MSTNSFVTEAQRERRQILFRKRIYFSENNSSSSVKESFHDGTGLIYQLANMYLVTSQGSSVSVLTPAVGRLHTQQWR
jgi:hypothetical protein